MKTGGWDFGGVYNDTGSRLWVVLLVKMEDGEIVKVVYDSCCG